MKLRNKKTGEIIDLDIANIKAQFGGISVIPLPIKPDGDEYVYDSLASLVEEWEDYEESKEYWYIDYDGRIHKEDYAVEEEYRDMVEIGNYFETKEEAEKAVEKLKAIKRLKDHNFHFLDHIDRDCGEGITRYEWDGYIDGEDLDLLFGGEDL